jgi:hypothetical protein
MPGGWGCYKLTLNNPSETPAKAVKWSARWEAGGKPCGDAFGDKLDLVIPAGDKATHTMYSDLPEEVYEKAKPGDPVLSGTVTIEQGDRTYEIGYRLAVPGAFLPEPTKLIKGKSVGIELMESHFEKHKHVDRALQWMEQAYEAMEELTGVKPFDGELSVIKECPEHPYWAYAGNPVVLNTKYVDDTLKDFDDGIISFGWVHEFGHNFDVLGPWYIWDGPSCEWQANFKLSYAFEHLADQSFRMRWNFQPAEYPARDKTETMTGTEFNERFFLFFGDPYLSDPNRSWDTMSSDELHSFFQRIQRMYGWDVFKEWYRTYGRLERAGKKPPETPEGKVRLICAILSDQAGVDLVPVFQRWRFPVTAENVKAIKEEYGL